jgi:hypothetical protein
VVSDNPKGIIGSAELNLADFGDEEPKLIRLELSKCKL